MNKRLIYLIFLFTVSLLTPVKATSYEAIAFSLEKKEEKKEKEKEKEKDPLEQIILRGLFQKGGGPRSCTDPIVAETQKDLLHIGFQGDLGWMEVLITNNQGSIVYITTVNTTVQRDLDISLLGFLEGTYTLDFRNQYGSVSGKFTL